MEIENIILIDKPKGITSFDVIRHLRRRFGKIKMGHAGTLDPLASGLMIIGTRGGTRELTKLIKLPKVYEAEILLGVRTATGDLEGDILEKRAVLGLEKEHVQEVVGGLKGKLELPVPSFSAVKVRGERLYKKARRGEIIDAPVKEMEVRLIELRDMHQQNDHAVLDVEMEVASGTYVRSVVEELGRRLDVPATVSELRRTRIGDFLVADAKILEEK